MRARHIESKGKSENESERTIGKNEREIEGERKKYVSV